MSETTEDRLERLECELADAKRRYRWLLTVLGIIVGGSIVAWTWPGSVATDRMQEGAVSQDTVRADAFVVKSPDGEARAELRAGSLVLHHPTSEASVNLSVSDQAGPTLQLNDDSGRTRSVLSLTNNGPFLAFTDFTNDSYQNRIELSAGDDGPVLGLNDPMGERRITLAVEHPPGPSLTVTDETGEMGATLQANKDGPALGLFFGKAQAARVSLSVNKTGAAVKLRDEAGRARALLGAGSTETPDGRKTTYPESSIRLAGPDGNLIWTAPR